MANYRRPGIEVIQEFQAAAPTLVTPDLPSVIVGPAFQVVSEDNVGNYTGVNTVYAYDSLLPGAIVDLGDDEDDLANYPVVINITEARIEFIAVRTVGESTADSKVFSDTTTVDAFDGAAVNDKLIITAGNDAGEYRITAVDEADLSKVTLDAELTETSTTVSYKVERPVDLINIPTDTSGVVVDEDGVELPSGLTYTPEGSATAYDIVSGVVELDYRALRIDLPTLRNYKEFSDLEAAFGVGQIVPENALGFGVNIARQNTTTGIGGQALTSDYMTDETIAHVKALDKMKSAKLEGTDIYSLVPLSQNPVIHQLYDAHVELYSAPEKKRERISFINRKSQTTLDIVEETVTSALYAVTGARADLGISDGTTAFKDTTTSNAFANVAKGDIIRIAEGGADDGDHVVDAKVDNTEVTLTAALTLTASDVDYQILRNDGLWANGTTFYDSNAQFITDGVEAGYYLVVTAGTGVGTSIIARHLISEVKSEKKIELATAVLGAPFKDVTYKIDRDYTVDEQAQYIADYATAFANRRLVLAWPDIVEIPVGSVIRDLPGYYLCCALSAMVSGLPPHQGFTNLTLVGFIGAENVSDKFDQDLLDVIASGGVCICDQDVEEAPLYVRHELTTDVSSITFQELMITKNVDSMAKLTRRVFQPYVGIYNITDGLISELRKLSANVMTYLKEDTRLPKIGAQLRDGVLVSLEESTTQPDTLESEWDLTIPYPFNNMNIRFLI